MGVRTRVTLVYIAVMAVVLVGVSAFLLARVRSEVVATIDDALRARTDELVGDVEAEPEEVGTPGGTIDATDPIAQIIDPSGTLVEWSEPVGPTPLVTSGAQTTAVVGGLLEPIRLLTVRTANGYTVVVGASLRGLRDAVGTLTRQLWIAWPAVLALSGVAVWLLAGAALRPVERLRAEAEALTFGIDGHRLPVPPTRDEVAALARTLNDMLTRLEAALERERRFVDDASHELRTPLTVLRSELELALARSRTPEELTAAIRSALDEVDALSALAERLLILARADRGRLRAALVPTDLGALVRDACSVLERRAHEASVTLALDVPDHLDARVDPVLLRQAVANLVDNALTHSPPGGRVDVTVSSTTPGAAVEVRDSGAGFDPDTLSVAFEPFTGGGTGLGLAIVWAIASAHGGTVEAENASAGGAVVRIRLPAALSSSSHRV